MKHYKDTSVFSGIAQYTDEYGNEWRRINKGLSWEFYKLKDGAFHFKGILRKPKGNRSIKTIKEIHNIYLDITNIEE